MQSVEIDIENCFGIKKMNQSFMFDNSNVNTIYARNGLMKTSFAKVFKCIQTSKTEEICDKIFNAQPVSFDIKIDGVQVSSNDVFVINSYENYYESESLNELLIDNQIKTELAQLLRDKDRLLKLVEKASGLKIAKSSAGKKIYELEPKIVADMGFDVSSILMNLNTIIGQTPEVDYSGIQYTTIFSDSSMKKILSDEFQNSINDYLDKSDEIYGEFSFLEKGSFSLGKLKEVSKIIDKQSFFVKQNALTLDGGISIESNEALKHKISEVENRIHTSNEFEKIEKLLSDVAGRELKEVIETNPDIVSDLTRDNVEGLRRKLWLAYFKKEEERVIDLKAKYEAFEDIVNQADIDDTPWKVALRIFENRFTVPYKMEIENIESAIIGESVPRVKFAFCKDGNHQNLNPDNWVRIDREALESANILSQGEKRALYLLNIIFDIERLKNEGNNILLIIDDIADSFDYKNKYAIVEYLKEISEYGNFFMLILSHNFDFYRTVSSRLNMGRNNRYLANKVGDEVKVTGEYYQKQPFKNWIETLNKKHTIALIPFVRNLVEYGWDKEKNTYPTIVKDFVFLTNLLHYKTDTRAIEISHIKRVYKEYLGNDNFVDGINDSDKLYDLVIQAANNTTGNDTRLEDKIILAISIRFVAEKYMVDEINNYTRNVNWRDRNDNHTGTTADFIRFLASSDNQTRRLFEVFIQFGSTEKVQILDKVNIMTPEMIHINSFMYEPILDMDICELLGLYSSVKAL